MFVLDIVVEPNGQEVQFEFFDDALNDPKRCAVCGVVWFVYAACMLRAVYVAHVLYFGAT